jgi:hypothetical protein
MRANAFERTTALRPIGDYMIADGGPFHKAGVPTISYIAGPNYLVDLDPDYFYGPGTHSWPYWQRDLSHPLNWLSPYIGHALPAPRSFSFRTADTSFSAWGWSFSVTGRDVREFIYLSHVGRGGFNVLGSGTLKVTTAPLYTAGAEYAVDVDGSSQIVTASPQGELALTIDMGPSHEVQQYRFGPLATLGWNKTTVQIHRI